MGYKSFFVRPGHKCFPKCTGLVYGSIKILEIYTGDISLIKSFLLKSQSTECMQAVIKLINLSKRCTALVFGLITYMATNSPDLYIFPNWKWHQSLHLMTRSVHIPELEISFWFARYRMHASSYRYFQKVYRSSFGS